MKKFLKAWGRAIKRDVWQNKVARLFVSLISLVLVVVIAVMVGKDIYLNAPVKNPKEVVEVTLPVDKLRVGIISDTQLPGGKSKDASVPYEEDHLRKALQLLKEQNVNMIIHAGDFCDVATSYAYKTYLRIFGEVYPDAEKAPYTLYVMGNHDTWFPNDYSSIPPKQRLYKKIMKVTPNTHVKVNGYHFIGASPDDTSNADGYSGTMKTWIQGQIDIAEKDAAKDGKPIFLITHHNIADTAFGSNSWGDERLRQAMIPYENVVSISGHSHYSILDERSIDQKMVTAFTTQSLAYIDMEPGMYDAFKGFDAKTGEFNPNHCYGTTPPRDTEKPMCLIMNVEDKQTTIERWNIMEKKEEKADRRWTLKYPLNRGTFTYQEDDRAMVSEAPVFPKDAKITVNPSILSSRTMENGTPFTLPGITFPAATHKDLVNSYVLKLQNVATGETRTYKSYSDYYLGVSGMSQTVDLALDPTLPSGKYKATVYATESFGKLSVPLTAEFDWQKPNLTIKN